MFIAVLFTIAKGGSVHQRMNGYTKCDPSTQWNILALERRETDTSYNTDEDIMLCEVSQSQKDTDCVIPLL